MENVYEDYIEYSTPKEEEPRDEITTLSKAEWALKKIVAAERRKAEASIFYDTELEKLETYLKKCYAEEDRTISYFTGLLMKFTMVELERTGSKKKSINLPTGQLSFSARQPNIERNDEVLLKFLKDNNADTFIEKKETVKWGDYKKTLKLTESGFVNGDGEIIPGIKVTPQEDIFKVKLNHKTDKEEEE